MTITRFTIYTSHPPQDSVIAIHVLVSVERKNFQLIQFILFHLFVHIFIASTHSSFKLVALTKSHLVLCMSITFSITNKTMRKFFLIPIQNYHIVKYFQSNLYSISCLFFWCEIFFKQEENFV
jgi:hypothetical protein